MTPIKLHMKHIIIAATCISLALVSCSKDNNNPAPPPPPEPTDQSFSTSFESMSELQSQGWVLNNLSDDPGPGWSIQTSTQFGGQPPFDGSSLLFDNYEAAN